MVKRTRNIPTYSKAPDALVDFGVDWAAPETEGGPWLAADETIVESAWTVPDGVTQSSLPTHDENVTTIWLEGGVLGQTYELTNHVTTNLGREDDQTIKVHITKR